MSDVKTDAQQSAAGKVVKFGLNQIGNPTPQWATWILRIWIYVSGFFTTILLVGDLLPADLKLKVAVYIPVITAGLHGLTKVFGWDYPNDSYYKKD